MHGVFAHDRVARNSCRGREVWGMALLTAQTGQQIANTAPHDSIGRGYA